MSKDLPFDMGDHILFLTKQQVDVLRKTFNLEFLKAQLKLGKGVYSDPVLKWLKRRIKELEGEE